MIQVLGRRLGMAATMMAAALLLAPAAQAAQVYFGNFNGANGGASLANSSGFFPGFAGTPPGFGKVDLFHSGDGGVTCGAGFTSCLSLESSDGHFGRITTIDPLLGPGQPAVSVAAGSTVTVSFEMSGNQRSGGPSDPDLVNVFLTIFGDPIHFGPVTAGGGWSDVIDPPGLGNGIAKGVFIGADSPFQLYTLSFVAPRDLGLSVGFKSGRLGVFTGSDGFGPILDYVAVDVTSRAAAAPEPASWALMLMGFGALGSALRRRRAYA